MSQFPALEELTWKWLAHRQASYNQGGRHANGVGFGRRRAQLFFDMLGFDKLFHNPKNLYDAWVLSIITPLVEIARDDTKLFELFYNRGPDGNALRKILKAEFEVPKQQLPRVLDWSHSYMRTLVDIGYESGRRFFEEHKNALETP